MKLIKVSHIYPASLPCLYLSTLSFYPASVYLPCRVISTLPLSSSLVIMTIVEERCSQIILQKSLNVSGRGP